MEEFLMQNWMLLIPIVVINYILVIVALVDMFRREHVAGGNKLIWALVVLLIQYIGPIIYFVFGRKE